MGSWKTLLRCALVILILSGIGPAGECDRIEAGPFPRPAELPLSQDGRMRPGEKDRCPVCAMPVGEHQKFVSAIALKDGTTFYFCAATCMLRSWLHPEFFLGVSPDRLHRCVVREYFTGDPVDGHDVVWVAGSDVVGPMGPALVPVRGKDPLEAFVRRHGAKATFRLGDLDDARWKAITGTPVLPE